MTDQTPQSSPPSAPLNLEGLNSEIGKAFQEVEASEKIKQFLLKKGLEQFQGFLKICSQKENMDSPLMVRILE